MDSLSTNNPDDKEPKDQAADAPAPSGKSAPEPVQPSGAGMAAGTDDLGKPKAAAPKLPDEAPIAATPKIDLANPGTSPDSEPVPEPAPAPAPVKKDLAGYEASDVAAVQPAEARPAVMAQTAKPHRSPVLWVVLAVVVLAALGGGAYWYKNRSSQTSSTASPSPSNNIALTSPSPSETPAATPTPSASPTPSPSTTPTPSATPQAVAFSASVGGNAVTNNQSVSVSTNRPVFSGNATPGNTVNVTLAPENIGLSATADQTGAWSITPSSDLPNGDHSATVSDGTSQVAFQLSVNPAASAGTNLSQTGDPVTYVSLFAALMLLVSIAGLRFTRRHG